MSNRIPKETDTIKISIMECIGGGWHIANIDKVTNAGGLTLLYCTVKRTFTNNSIQPPTIEKLCIPAEVVDIWSFYPK